MERISKALRAPGARGVVEYAAPTQVSEKTGKDENGVVHNVPDDNANSYAVIVKARLLDRWLDKVVRFFGSQFIFFAIVAALLTWVLLGIHFGHSNDWQVGISDAQAIINMIFDALLMRQQLNSHESLMFVAACLRSRTTSNKRMLRMLIASGEYEGAQLMQFDELGQTEPTADLPSENWLGRISNMVSGFIGHIATVCAFWVCILIWIGFGHYCGWSNTWQLYINSATSAWMVFILAFLANIHERHDHYMTNCLEYIYKTDVTLELRLRTFTGDKIENETVIIPAPKRGRLQRAIDYYADLVGTLLGIGILFFVIIIWIVIGPAMSFDSNWWLLIGTYAGLVGVNDGFVLCNVQHILSSYQDTEFTQLVYDDMDMLAVIGAEQVNEERVADNSLSYRISIFVGSLCSHEMTVVLGGVLIVGLIIGASVMSWSVTGQLLCNIPPSIIESFFVMVLIAGHNVEDANRRVEMHNLYLRRLKLISYTNSLAKVENKYGDYESCWLCRVSNFAREVGFW